MFRFRCLKKYVSILAKSMDSVIQILKLDVTIKSIWLVTLNICLCITEKANKDQVFLTSLHTTNPFRQIPSRKGHIKLICCYNVTEFSVGSSTSF